MRRDLVESTSIRSIGYDPDALVLEIEFHSGRIYQYDGVPPGVFEWLMRSPSKGSFFNRQIKDRYPERSMSSREPEQDLLSALRGSLGLSADDDDEGA